MTTQDEVDDVPEYSLHELAEATGTSRRTLERFLNEKVLPPVEFRAQATSYGEEHRAAVLEVVNLRKQGLNYAAIRHRLAEKRRAAPAPAPATLVGPYRYSLARPHDRWERIALAPGVELHVRTEADAEAWRLAKEIVDVYGR